jgi:hypothetical protein
MTAKLLIAGVAVVIMSFVAAGIATATVPITTSAPFQAVCEAQGGVFDVSIDSRSVYCSKEGALYTAFTDNQLDVQHRICGRVYGAVFGVFGELPNTTVTFCFAE